VTDYLHLNRASWDQRAPVHADSPTYGVDRFVADPAFISDVVRFDLPRLGDIRGLTGVHLQCHIGTDTLSLARLGATMTGLDFSGESLRAARALAERCGETVAFVEGDVYDAPDLLGEGRFDLVFTGIGALCWLPSIGRWADVVDRLLTPGGRVFMREGHPVLWALDYERDDDLLVLDYPYVERDEPVVETSSETYVETDRVLAEVTTHSWNHGLGEIVTALLDRGLVVTELVEHDSVPWEALPGRMDDVGDGEYRLRDRPWRLPHSYTLQARKPG